MIVKYVQDYKLETCKGGWLIDGAVAYVCWWWNSECKNWGHFGYEDEYYKNLNLITG